MISVTNCGMVAGIRQASLSISETIREWCKKQTNKNKQAEKKPKKQNQTNKQKVGHDRMNVQEESHNIYGTSRGLGKIIKAI